MWARTTFAQLGRRLRGTNPFEDDCSPGRVPLFATGRPSLPVPHPWNYREPLRILETYFWGTESETGPARHNRYFDVPGLPVGLVTREPAVIRAVLSATGDKPGQFYRDQAPAKGIARFTGPDTMLYANRAQWRRQKKLTARSFARTTLFQPETFHEFEQTFRKTVTKRIERLRAHLETTGQETIRIELEPEISAVMLEMLVNNFFGGRVSYEELRERYAPAIAGLIDHMVRETVGHQVLTPLRRAVGADRKIRGWKRDFEHLVDITLSGRKQGLAGWEHFESDAPDERLRSNIRVFLAGALEATTSYAAWALSHLSRQSGLQEEIEAEIRHLDHYDPENLAQAVQLNHALEESLRLTPALYFLPRWAATDTNVETGDGRRLHVPKGTHLVLDVWHANRCEDFWGVEATGWPADVFAPQRWARLASEGKSPKETMHFGFGYGPRVCPGKYLGLLEVGLVVGAFLKVFRCTAVNETTGVKAAVSTKPADGVLVELGLR